MKFEGNHELPSLDFNEEEGKLRIWGRSISTEARADFWKPLIEKMKDYLDSPRDIVVEFDLEFFSTVSAMLILEFLKLLQDKVLANKGTLVIKWVYEDEDGRESGEDYASIVSKPEWRFIEKKENI